MTRDEIFIVFCTAGKKLEIKSIFLFFIISQQGENFCYKHLFNLQKDVLKRLRIFYHELFLFLSHPLLVQCNLKCSRGKICLLNFDVKFDYWTKREFCSWKFNSLTRYIRCFNSKLFLLTRSALEKVFCLLTYLTAFDSTKQDNYWLKFRRCFHKKYIC